MRGLDGDCGEFGVARLVSYIDMDVSHCNSFGLAMHMVSRRIVYTTGVSVIGLIDFLPSILAPFPLTIVQYAAKVHQ